MIFPDSVSGSATRIGLASDWREDKWPLGRTLLFLLSFGSFAWITVIFACFEYL